MARDFGGVADQPGVDGKSRIDLAGKSAWLQVRQDDGLARLDLLTPAIFAFRQSLATGARLQDAVEVALNRAADFDVRAAVGALFAERLLTGWRLAPAP